MSNPVSRLNAALQGRYRIERELGQGGMATVYLADDLRHERKVALKVLKPELAAVVGPERFLAEIRTTANLQHPHILPLFDSGEASGFLFYVMPYVEGESLRERLDREKQLPVDEAVFIATKVAGALQAAHDRGVIHRDIKPANILLANGEPLVADFGIALAVSAAGGGRLTETGLSLGTPYYMSPEQATGDRDPDARADVYSLGCVLYEMLTGEPPHTGSTAQAVLGKILTADPVTLSAQRRAVPRHVEAVVMQALEKLPADRFASATAFADKLQDPAFAGARTVRSPADSPSRLRRITISAVAVASVAVVAAVWGWSGRPGDALSSSTRVVRSVIGEAHYLTFGNTVTISPDGETVVYVGGEEVGHQLYRRRMDDLVATAIPGTEGARSPFFSPDGEWIAFTRALGIEKVRLAGGSVVTVRADSVGVGGGATWHDGWIYFTLWGGRGLGSLVRIPEDGGGVETLWAQDPQRPRDFWWWAHLPGTRSLLLSEIAGREHLTLLDLENNLLRTDSTLEATTPHFIPPHTLVFGRSDGSVLAAPFDPERGELTGSPVRLASSVEVVNGTPQFAVSASGTLVYAEDDGDDLVWETLDGSSSRPVTNERRNFSNTVGLSPDGSQVAVSTFEGSSQEIRVYDAETGRGENLTRGERAISPVWSPDGRLTYGSRDRGLILHPPSGMGDPEVLLQGLAGLAPTSWSPTGDHLAYMMDSAWQGWILDPSTGESTTLGDDLSFFGPVDYSPDGSLVALQSSHLDERSEVYVEALESGLPAGNRIRVSFEGGIAPHWSLDGRQLYYLRWQSEQTEAQLVAVDIDRSPALSAGTGIVMATWPSEVIDYKYRFELHPNGRELIRVRSKPTRRLVLLQNWQALLEAGATPAADGR